MCDRPADKVVVGKATAGAKCVLISLQSHRVKYLTFCKPKSNKSLSAVDEVMSQVWLLMDKVCWVNYV